MFEHGFTSRNVAHCLAGLCAVVLTLGAAPGASQSAIENTARTLAANIVENDWTITSDTLRDLSREAAGDDPERALRAAFLLTDYYTATAERRQAQYRVDQLTRLSLLYKSDRHLMLAMSYQHVLDAPLNGNMRAISGLQSIIERTNDWFVKAYAHAQAANLATFSGNHGIALNHINDGFTIINSADAAAKAPSAALYSALALSYTELNDYEAALGYQDQAVRLAVEAELPVDGAAFLYNIAMTLAQQPVYLETALELSEITNRLAAETGDKNTVFFANLLCADLQNLAGRPETAKRCIENAVQADDIPAQYYPEALETNIINALALNELPRAKSALMRLDAFYLGNANLYRNHSIEDLQSKILYAEGDFQGAYRSLELYTQKALTSQSEKFSEGVQQIRATLEADLGVARDEAMIAAREADLAREVSIRQQMIAGLMTILCIGVIVAFVVQQHTKSRLKAARHEADRANKAKSDFLATMSHELRTPLNGVLGTAQALQTAPSTPPEFQDQVRTILDSGTALTALLNDILDLSKIEAGKIELSPVDGDLGHALHRIQRLFKQSADEKAVDLRLDLPEDFPEQLNFDPVRVRQCVANLVSNAVKFTQEGFIEIIARHEPMNEDGMIPVAIKIKDSGIGISDEAMEQLFQPFTQADASITRKFGGTGLGLTISRRLAQVMQGDLTVESTVGEGSTFTLTFLAGKAAPNATARTKKKAEAAANLGSNSLKGRRILIVEDNKTNRDVLKLFLTPQSPEKISEVENGLEALAILEEDQFDVIFMDVQMPEMDGLTATRKIRENSADWSATPIIGLTADATPEDRQKCLDAGMNDYTSKPIDANALFAAVARVLARRTADIMRHADNETEAEDPPLSKSA